MIINDKNSTVC